VINLKTAMALGLTVPHSLLTTTDEHLSRRTMSAFDPKRTSTEEWAVVPGTVDQRSEGLAQAIYRDTS